MNILYVLNKFSVIEPMGILQLSAITKASGHRSFICDLNISPMEQIIQNQHIDIVAFSLMSTEAPLFLNTIRFLKKRFPDLIMIAGGPHPTYFPGIIDTWPLDAIIIGEGDAVIVPLIEKLFHKDDISGIPNIHTKAFKNAPGDLIDDLDTLPWPDRELVANIIPLKYVRIRTFFATRGCPYNCSYCFNNAYNRMFKNKGNLLRRRSVKNLINEIENVVRRYPADFIRFGDDAFIVKHDDWIKEFTCEYKKRIRIPFYFLISPNLVSAALAHEMWEAGCHSVMMGIETGNEHLRKTVLNRPMTDETILNAFKIFRAHDIKIFSNTMLGLPDSTLADDLQSLDFTLQCQPYYAGFTVATPFPGTQLHEYCKCRGYLNAEALSSPDAFPVSMQQSSILTHVTDQQKAIHRNIITLAPIAAHWPSCRKLITHHMIFWKPNFIFDLFGFVMRNYLNMNVWPFKKSFISFLIILKQVLWIDIMNFGAKNHKDHSQKEE